MNCPHCGVWIEPEQKPKCERMVQAAYDTKPHRCPFNAINGKFCKRHSPENLKLERDNKIEQLKKIVAQGTYLLKQLNIKQTPRPQAREAGKE